MTTLVTTLTSPLLAVTHLATSATGHDPGGATPPDVLGLGSRLLTDVNALARATPWLHGVMYGYATYGVALFAVLLVAGWWTARRSGDPARVAAAVWAGLGTLAAVGINQPIVNAVHEARPYQAMQGLLVLANRSSDYSFPSDHATLAGAVAAGLFLVSRRLLAWISAVAAVLIAFARVYIAAHYPLDVVAGLILGGLVVLAGWILVRRPMTAAVRWLQTTPVRWLVTTTPVTTPSR